MRIDVHNHADEHVTWLLGRLIKQGEHMAVDLKRIKDDIAALKTDADDMKAAAEKGAADMDAIKAKLDALAQAGDGTTAAEIEAIALAVEGVSAELKGAATTLKSASDRDNPPTIALPAGKVGEPYVASIDVPDPEAVSGIIQSGSFPPGLMLVLEELSGTPTTAGDYAAVVWHIAADGMTHVGPPTNYTVSIAQ